MKAQQVVTRWGCLACTTSYYAVQNTVCPRCGGQGQPVGSRGPLPGTDKSPESYTAVLTVRVSQETVTKIDDLRGSTARSAWLRQQIDESIVAAEELDGLE